MAGVRSVEVEIEINKEMRDVLWQVRDICREHGIQEAASLTDFLRRKLCRLAASVEFVKHLRKDYEVLAKTFEQPHGPEIAVCDEILRYMDVPLPEGDVLLAAFANISGQAIHQRVLEQYAKHAGCECGGDAAGTTHSEWCPKAGVKR